VAIAVSAWAVTRLLVIYIRQNVSESQIYINLAAKDRATRTRDIPIPLRVHCARERSEIYSLNGSKHGSALGLFDDAVLRQQPLRTLVAGHIASLYRWII
jgi:hypothetical protein